MPPKLLLVLDVPVYVLKAFYLLPSLMHRLESLMLASQLREEIDFRSSNFGIPSSMVCFIAFITLIVLETSLSFNNNLISFYAIDPGSVNNA